MASFQIATKADLASVLPGLLIALHLQQEQTSLPTVSKSFHDGATLPSKEAIQMTLGDGKTWSGKAIVRYLAELASRSDSNTSPQRASSIQEWVDKSESFFTTDFKTLRKSLYELNKHLTLRSFIVGYHLTVADLAVWATIRGNRISHSLIKQNPIQENVHRWYTYIEDSNPWLLEAIAELTNFGSKERAAASAMGASYEIDLPQVDGPMVTRFPPEPSGYLHIESMEFQDAILEDLKMMAVISVSKKTSALSSYFQKMYEYAIQLIKAGKAFADDSELGRGDEDRKNRLPSKRRNLSIEETLERFADMKTGSEEGQRWCLRARIAYDSPNGTLRDPVIYRCNLIPHHRTGRQWNIYPTYDFCAPILDSIKNITVALRTNEYRDRNVQYEWMQDALGLCKVPIWDFSRLSFIRTVLSKRKLTRIVDNGKVWGWDDPRMPMIRGILRRGITVPALREFILRQEPSRNILNLEWGALWALNKKYINPEAARHTAIVQDNTTYSSVATKPKYIKNLDLGTKKVVYDKTILLEQVDAQSLAENEEIALMNWGNAYARRIYRAEQPDETGKHKVTAIEFEQHLEGDVKKTKKKISWLATVSSNLIPVDLVGFNYLLTKDKLEKEDRLEDFLEPDTEFRTRAFADCNVRDLSRGAIIRFERKGYYKLDVEYRSGEGSRMVFFDVPSGKA
ncbi:glutamyl-tRNA synthetase [Hyaloscypha bicolor E]|uniref:Glutamyl-tRNA synthetase n=1 Tax=Hyaloscypha bicolor E TaxID=1095630 RepID=A0A2J6TAA0_9HELO|nr:glutamyl-tRNA synthetase [Hyaloscypha bicolor E]PMD59928.1 glutamyl-tRNA synthetase [Hyaloscypha bicolor E]